MQESAVSRAVAFLTRNVVIGLVMWLSGCSSRAANSTTPATPWPTITPRPEQVGLSCTSYGWIEVSPVVPGLNPHYQMLEYGAQITAQWIAFPRIEGAAVEFYFEGDNGTRQHMGRDASLADGASVTWRFPSGAHGRVAAELVSEKRVWTRIRSCESYVSQAKVDELVSLRRALGLLILIIAVMVLVKQSDRARSRRSGE